MFWSWNLVTSVHYTIRFDRYTRCYSFSYNFCNSKAIDNTNVYFRNHELHSCQSTKRNVEDNRPLHKAKPVFKIHKLLSQNVVLYLTQSTEICSLTSTGDGVVLLVRTPQRKSVKMSENSTFNTTEVKKPYSEYTRRLLSFPWLMDRGTEIQQAKQTRLRSDTDSALDRKT